MPERGGAAGGGGPRVVLVTDLDDGSDSSSTESSSSSEDESRFQESARSSDLSSEFWQIQKLVKYMKARNQTATVIALCCLKDHDLTTDANQTAIRDTGGLEVLVNLIETDDFKCKLGSLSVLSKISTNTDVRRCVTDLGAVPLLVNILSDQAKHLQILAAETISNVAKVRKARRSVRRCGGIPKLVDLLDVSPAALCSPLESLSADDQQQVDVARAGAKALWSLSQSVKNKEAMRRTGCVRLLAKLLKSCHQDVVVPIMGTIQQCASEKNYQLAIQTEGMIIDLVRHLSDESMELKKHCASAIFKCAEDEITRDLVRQNGGLDPLVKLARDSNVHQDKPLLAAVTGAIWKCSMSPDNVRRFDELRTVEVLVSLLQDESEEVLTNVVGGLAQCAKFPHNREVLRNAKGIPLLVQLLNSTNQSLLENVALVLGECANEKESMAIIEELDGVRLIWSLLKNPSPRVQANAAWALCPCIHNAKNSGEMVRSFVGGLELIVSLLRSSDINVLACVCAALSKIALDKENLAIITDHGVVPMLAQLVLTIASRKDSIGSVSSKKKGRKSEQCDDTEDDREQENRLQEHLAEAIANCCRWGNNCHEFGRLGSITPLVGYMASKDKAVHRTTAYALHQLSTDPFNCITMHQSGVVPYLLETIGSSDEKLQEASAGCLSNIRKLALSAEKFKNNEVPF
ncbi:armadillo repeat-containing protein gudu [Schistocerca nitens]|uniref:armadillo repeat-containing protein gudu n=1 Tax=Schistocerca nitens TaxID=7011 RepID=UPI002118DF9F|nr:armadillo repeat-containing protein gudu [Schistocerca nitens]